MQEFDEKTFEEMAKKVFIGEGRYTEVIRLLVEELGKVFPLVAAGEMTEFSDEFCELVNENIYNRYTSKEGHIIATDFVNRARNEFFAKLTADYPEYVVGAKRGEGPLAKVLPKWIFIYQYIVMILSPSPCGGGCGGCGGGCGDRKGECHGDGSCGGCGSSKTPDSED